jgi:hypothetical protein
MITDNDEDSDVAPMAAVVSPSVALRFKEYRDVVVIPYNNSEDYRQLSVAAWVYCEKDASCSSDPCYLLAKKGSFALGLRSDEIAMAFHNKRPGWQWIGSRWRMPAQTWTHVVVVYDSTYEQACTYANGRLVSTQQVKGKLKGSTQPLLIGVELKPDKGTRTRFKGLISYVTLWKHTIAPDTINQHLSGAITGTERGIIGHWPMTEGVGEKIFDASPNKLDGDINFALWWMNSDSVGHVDVPKSTLVEDMRKMFNSPLGSDLKLIASDGRELHAHKIILAMRSEAFRALLFGGMRESTQAEIQFPDIKYEVLTLVVEFLYTDTANITGDIVVGLFMAADQYQLGRLRALCEDFILQNISIENVCTIFQTADQLQAHKLRGFCFNWIINNFGEVLTCDAYPQLPAELQREINYAAAKMHFGKKRKLDEATSEP